MKQSDQLTCKKHNRILIGKNYCVDCKKEQSDKEWEKEFDIKYAIGTGRRWIFTQQEAKDIKSFIQQLLAQTKDEGYVDGYKHGSGSIAVDIVALKAQYEKGKREGAEEVIEELKGRLPTKLDPMSRDEILEQIELVLSQLNKEVK